MAKATEGASLPCIHCGAPVEIGSGAQATCAFCLGAVDVPVQLRQPLADEQALRARLQQARADLQGARSGAASGRRALIRNIALAVLVLALLVGYQGAVILFSSYDPEAGLQVNPLAVVQPLMMCAVYVLAIGLMVLNLAFGKLVDFRRATRVPFAVPEGARARCPSCGASVSAGRGLTVRCGSCHTEMLLPSYLVAVKLRKRHHDVVMKHQEVGHHQRGQQLASAASLGCGGLLYLGFAASMLAVPPVLVLVSVTGWVPMGGGRALAPSGPPALVVGAAFGFSGMRMFWGGFQTWRAGQGR